MGKYDIEIQDSDGNIYYPRTRSGCIKVTLTSSGWTQSSQTIPYTQTVSVQGMKAEYEPILVRVLETGTSENTQKDYEKAFAIIAAGAGKTGDGTVTFWVYKKPKTDCTVGLKGV